MLSGISSIPKAAILSGPHCKDMPQHVPRSVFPLFDIIHGLGGSGPVLCVYVVNRRLHPIVLCSENNLRCSPPTLTSAQTLWSSIKSPTLERHRMPSYLGISGSAIATNLLG